MDTRTTLYDLFKISAEKFPCNPAVCFRTANSSTIISYSDIYEESAKVDDVLSKFVVESSFIGVFVEQNLCLPTIIIGILRAGFAFMCLKQEHLDQPLNLLDDLKIRWIFSNSDFTHECWSSCTNIYIHGSTITLFENRAIQVSPCMETSLEHNSWKMAYAIHTSGTTGQPKVIRVPHRCIVPNILHLQSILSVESNDVLFLGAPSTFDPSVVEIFLALSTGALLLIVPQIVKLSPHLLLRTLFSGKKYGITILQVTPSFMMQWSKEKIQNMLSTDSTLRVLILGGEPCPSMDVLRQWKARGNSTNIFNIYGITEVSCWATIHKVVFQDESQLHCDVGFKTPDSETISNEKALTQNDDTKKDLRVPLGNALSHTLLAVKSSSGEEILDGEGELYIGSMERICLVDNESIQNLTFPVYRATGDIVKLDGCSKQMFYIGRQDCIIKRFGNRVHLDEIEKLAASHRHIEQACCVCDEQSNKLGLFVRLEESNENDSHLFRSLKLNLLKTLQPSSVPDVIINLKSLPLTSHGKRDQKKMKHLLIDQIKKDMNRLSELQNACEVFSFLWSQYLCIESYPAHSESFLQAGGNSILALQLVSEMEKVLHTSAFTNLISMLLGGDNFEDCCAYVCPSNQSTTHNTVNSNVLSKCVHMVNKQKEESRKRPDSEKENYLNLGEGTSAVLHVDADIMNSADNITISCCRGKSEIFEGSTEPFVISRPDKINLRIKWKFALGRCVDASPRFIQYNSGCERVLVGSHSHMFSIIDSRTGKSVAQCDLMDRIESSACVSSCGRFGFVGSYDGNMYCINLCSGEFTWIFPTGGMVKSSPVLCLNGSAVAFGSYDRLLYCLNILSGQLIWSNKVGNGSICSSPCTSVSTQALFVAALDGTCVSLAQENGRIQWHYKCGSPVFSSPAVLQEESAVLFAEVSGIIHCLSTENGNKFWDFHAAGKIFSSFCVLPSRDVKNTNLIMFGCHDNRLYCLEASSSTYIQRWTCDLGSSIFSTPFVFPILTACEKQIKDEMTESVHDKREECLVSVASSRGTIYIIGVNNGNIKCSFDLPSEVFSSPVVYRNCLYVGCRDNYVYSFIID